MDCASFGTNRVKVDAKKWLLATAITSLVSCGGGSGGGSDQNTSSENRQPTANAGADMAVSENTSVTLVGAGQDSDGTVSEYAWIQTGGIAVTFDDAGSATTAFVSPEVTEQEVLTFELSVTDDDGAIATDSVQVTVSPVPVQLDGLTAMYSGTPAQNQALTVTLVTDDHVGDVSWIVTAEPESSDLTLEISSDKKSVTFTPVETGSYKLLAQSSGGASEKIISFAVAPVFPFDESKIEGNDGSVNLDELIGVIRNQVWVYSVSLSETQLREIVATYSDLTVVGYDSFEGLLVQFDDTNFSTREILEELKLESGISSVEQRTYVGENAEKEFFTPDDGDSFNDQGSNWHLENSTYSSNLVEAWDYTRGSEDVVVGVTDSGFYSNHEDLEGRFSSVLTSDKDIHGTGVVGAIGASADNTIGISGVNHISLIRAAKDNKYAYASILSDEKVRVINNSWGEMGNDSDSIAKGIFHTRTYRKIAQSSEDVLHVWASGNDGADAKTQNGAIHLNTFGGLSKVDNVVVVGAIGLDGSLVHYSDFGETIDLVAPTEFKSTRDVSDEGESSYFEGSNYGVSEGDGFGGTSAAAPVVSGVASLIYSLYPGFSGKEVKDILVESATEFVSERYITSGPAGENNSNVELLINPIPILNAESALENAQEIIDGKVSIADSIPDPFVAQARISFASIDEQLDVVGIDWELQSSTDGGSTWQFVSGMSVSGDIAEPSLDTATPNQRIVATVTLRNPDTNVETTANKQYEFNYTTLDLVAVDTVSLSALPAVELAIEPLTGPPISATGNTDVSGSATVYLKSGDYRIRGNLSGYQNAVTSFSVSNVQNQQVSLNMTEDSLGSVGSISGRVVNLDGDPVAGASVRISGGQQTNGFFASASTDANGNYVISNISKNDSEGDPIPSFLLEASASGLAAEVKADVIVLSGKERVENFTLIPVSISESTIFTDDFELDMGGWIATGFWNQIDLANSTIENSLVENGYTSLAPDESGPDALLPEAFSGDFVWWYGQPSTGSFIGEQTGSDLLLSGGTSITDNSGQLTSPSISLTSAATPMLQFRTWWEIESVNPNDEGFDIMEVQISTDGGNSFEVLKKLNPFVDPNDSDRNAKPFSSGGYNRKPVWVLEEIDLSAYAGEVVNLRFDFSSRDGLYNGFRGWIVDKVEVVDFTEEEVSGSILAKAHSPENKPNNLVKAKKEQGEFYRIHKMPRSYPLENMPPRD